MTTQTQSIPESLRELKAKFDAARAAYHGHRFSGDASDTLAQIAFDIEDRRLLRASSEARTAYENALEDFMASEAA